MEVDMELDEFECVMGRDESARVELVSNNMWKKLPIRIESDKEYLPTLQGIYDDYCKAVVNAGILEANIIELIQEVCSNVIKALECYYDGLPSKAFWYIKKLFAKDKLGQKEYIRNISDFSLGTEYKTLYKGRVAEEITNLKEMFHRPFSQRQYMTTERYSIPGLPCLYLAGSVYTCWQEIGRPDFKDFFVSRYEASEEVKVLDLAIAPIYGTFWVYDDDISCVLWPLVCAISFLVKEKNRVMKSEYIIPQLLMQMVIGNKAIDGIRYFSVHMPQEDTTYASPVYVNYAFPAPYSNKEDYSKKLGEKFKLTSPICMNEMFTLSEGNIWTISNHRLNNSDMYLLESKYQNENRRNAIIRVGLNKITEYEHTAFYKVEDILYKFNVHKYDE